MAERHHALRHPTETTDEALTPPEAVIVEEPEAQAAPVLLESVPPPEPAPSTPVVPSAHLLPLPMTPTLTQAFTVLCAALQGHLEDNQVLSGHCDEIQGWNANSGGDDFHVNSIMAWRHAVQLLEGVLGHPLTLG